MNSITIPHPDEIRSRIASCEAELRALKKLLRVAQLADDAEDARQRREAAASATPPGKGADNASS
jgi:hypothetical protein